MKTKNVALTTLFGSIAAVASVVAVAAAGRSGLSKIVAVSGESWTHYEAVANSCKSAGSKEYWVSCSTHEHVFEAPASANITEGGAPTKDAIRAMNDDRVLHAEHNFDANGFCEDCGWTNFINATNVREYDKLTATADIAPDGFATVYHYTGTSGGGTSSFFNASYTEASTKFGGFNRFKFAILSDRSKVLNIFNFTNYQQWRLPYPDYGADPFWVTVTADKQSDNSWNLSVDRGQWTQYGGSGSGVSFNVPVTGSYLREIFTPIGNGNTDFYMTEVLGGFQSEDHKHSAASGQCSECGKYILDYGTYVTKQDCLSETTMDAPHNFSKVYKYSEAVGGASDSCFFKHAYINTSSFTSFEFAVWNKDGNVRYRNYDGGAQTYLTTYDIEGAFTKIVLTINSDSKFDVTINGQATGVVSPRNSSLYAIFQLLVDNAPFYITEALYTK